MKSILGLPRLILRQQARQYSQVLHAGSQLQGRAFGFDVARYRVEAVPLAHSKAESKTTFAGPACGITATCSCTGQIMRIRCGLVFRGNRRCSKGALAQDVGWKRTGQWRLITSYRDPRPRFAPGSVMRVQKQIPMAVPLRVKACLALQARSC